MFVAQLVIVAVLALFSGASAQSACGSDTKGTTGTLYTLPDVPLQPGYSVFNVTLPPNPCGGLTHVGTSVTACDDDSAPLVYLYTIETGTVTRTGNLKQEGVVHTYVYCVPDGVGRVVVKGGPARRRLSYSRRRYYDQSREVPKNDYRYDD